MRRSGVSNAAAAGLLIAGILIGATGFYVATTYQAKTATQTSSQKTSSQQSGNIEITSANISAQYLWATVQNTGSLNLMRLGQPTLSVGECRNPSLDPFEWAPSPSSTYPIYTGEKTTGGCMLNSEYRSGLQVTVSVTATFSDGSHATASKTFTTG